MVGGGKDWGEKLISNNFTSHSFGQVILLRKNCRRILIAKFEIVSQQIAVVNVNTPAGSQECDYEY